MSSRATLPEAPLDLSKRSGPGMFSLSEQAQSSDAAGKGKNKKINSYNIIFMAMITSSVLVIVSMRLLNKPIATAEASETISYDRPDIDPKRQAAQERMLASLQNTQTNLNVDPKTLGYSPMLTRERKVDPVTAAPIVKTIDPIEKKRQEMLANRKSAFEKLELSGTTLGRVPVARINGELFKIGDKVGEIFTIKAITQRTVELTHEGTTLTLEQHEKAKDGKQGKSSIKRLPPQ